MKARLWASEAVWQAIPNLAAFFPGEDPPLRGPRPAGAVEFHPDEGPWQAPAFGGRRCPIALVLPGAPNARWADPWRGWPMAAAEGLALLAEWRRQAAENAGIAAFLGMAGWKRAAIAAAFGHAGPAIPFAETEAAALALAQAARARGETGAIAAWATRAAPGLAGRCAEAGIPLLWVEDGFLRSVGLGVNFIPSASLAVDGQGPHYDPGRASTLETILAEAAFPKALLDRAARLRQAIVEQGLTKYNLGRRAQPLPASPGRRRILVVGQVEDDASITLGAGRVRTNLALLEAVRRAEPEAFLIFRPHPDVETGYRRGYVPRRAALRFADAVVAGGDIDSLFAQVDAVHGITSLAGFEALLRGLPVTTWGMPFYAGWGLTADMEPPPRRGEEQPPRRGEEQPPRRGEEQPPRRGRSLSLDALVAGALILYPRYLDPVSLLPCGPELLLERLADRGTWPKLPPGRRAAVLGWRYMGWWLKQCRRFGLWRR